MAIIPVHTMRDQPDYVGTMQRGMAFGNQLRQQRQEEERRNKLAQLGAQAYGAQGADRQALIGQAVGVDMQQGLALGDALRQNDAANMSAEDAQAKRLRGAAKVMMQAIETNDPVKIRGAHQAVANFMNGFGQPFPAEFTPDMVPKIQEVLARTAYLDDGGTGVAVQSRFIDDQGNMVALMRDGTTKVVGKADPNMQIIEGEGGFYGVNRRNLNAAPVQLGGSPQQAAPQRTISNVQYRTEDGQPIPQEEMAALQQAMQAAAAGQDVTIPVGGQPQFGGQLRKRSPEEEAAAVAQAKATIEAQTAAEIERAKVYGRQSGEAQANAQFGSDDARKSAREAATKLPQLQNAARGVGRIRTALDALSRGRFGGLVDTGPIDQALIRYTPEGRELESAVGGIQNSILALTRVPGVGAQSDLEARVAALQYPSLDNPPEVNARTMQNLEALISDLQAAYENVISAGSRQPAPRDAAPSRPAAPRSAPSSNDPLGIL